MMIERWIDLLNFPRTNNNETINPKLKKKKNLPIKKEEKKVKGTGMKGTFL